MLTEALPGANAIEAPKSIWSAVVRQLAVALRALHATPTSDCPFDRGLSVIIESAYARTMAGLVDEADFDEERKGVRARELLPRLELQRPADERLVITHGDACLANMIFDGRIFAGFVDCSRSGLADAYQDLALASRSIANKYGAKYRELFFEEYGLHEIDEHRLSFYRLADEFF